MNTTEFYYPPTSNRSSLYCAERIPLLGFNFSSNSDFKSLSELVKSFKPVYLVYTETFGIFPALLALVPYALRAASSLERSFDFPV